MRKEREGTEGYTVVEEMNEGAQDQECKGADEILSDAMSSGNTGIYSVVNSHALRLLGHTQMPSVSSESMCAL